MSSRNCYLSASERTRAPAIYLGLRAASRAFARGERDRAKLERLVLAPIEAAFDIVDYAKVADADDLSDPGPTAGEASVLLVAARIGATRLIDNCRLGSDCL
jgi:pantoate--beta-alanine ligase